MPLYVCSQIGAQSNTQLSTTKIDLLLSCEPPEFFKNPYEYLRFLIMPLSASEKAGLERSQKFRETGFGYFNQQATKPQTLGYSLTDSPVGLLAWIYEKLVGWTDNYLWTDDEGAFLIDQTYPLIVYSWWVCFGNFHSLVLTWISIYWFSRAGPAASLRIYYEIQWIHNTSPPLIPRGVSYFPHELVDLPRRQVFLCDCFIIQTY
jgi:hypothetical protein